MTITLEQIKELIEFIKGHDLNEFELEQDGVKIRIKTSSNHHVVAVPQLPATMPIMAAAPIAAPPTPAQAAASAAEAKAAADQAAEDGGELCIVKSPLVGTVYRAAEPGATPFVAVGATVRQGPAPCSLEATEPANASAAEAKAAADQAAEDGGELCIVKSPIVGTFYRAAEPGATPFVAVGDTVRKGQVLCIIEAMKLMNEIDSEYDGEVTSIYVENGQAVQYGERLIAIKPSH